MTDYLRIAHINFSDTGGAANAASRLIAEQNVRPGIQAKMYAVTRTSEKTELIGGELARLWVRFIGFSIRKLFRPTVTLSFNLVPTRILKAINKLEVDIVHLHWVGAETIAIPQLAKIKKPIVWTFHDPWPLSGADHYNNEAELPRRLEKFIRRYKSTHFAKIQCSIITNSNWLAKETEKAGIFRSASISCIHNGINLEKFKPLEKDFARQQLGIQCNEPIILFGAVNAINDERKGFSYLVSAIQKLSKGGSNQFRLMVFGDSGENSFLEEFNVIRLGRINDENKLPLVYSAADIFVAPSVQDALPTTLIEAISCGVPGVAFECDGMPEIIDHKKTGYLAEPRSSSALGEGIAWCLDNSDSLRSDCRESAINKFNVARMVEKYDSVYKSIRRT